ncbi:MAG TPA: ABC transporter permease [Bryobacteraceae bacterium]|jgi:putative ABC transport system permease protein|nr:ABC transporter permease [Bryobacteraceae bacterium]
MRGNASFWESGSVALDSLRSSKLRSFLTLLGIILATATLIAVMSVIHGMDVYIAQNVSDLGADGFRVVRMAFLGDFSPKKLREFLKKNPELKPEEFRFLKDNTTLLQEIGMQVETTSKVSAGTQNLDGVELDGVTANFGVLNNVDLTAGRFFTDADDSRRLPAAILGKDIQDRFFASADPLGKTIKVDGRPFTVIGVAKAKGSVFGQSLDNYVLIPAGTYFQIYGSRSGISYLAKAKDRTVLEQAQDETRMLLRAYRHLRPGQDDNFAVISSDAIVGAWDRITGTIAATAVAVVSVFMVVGGVVIMNIMLAVVSERTREIGIRKAVGARRQDILNQFLVESSMLSGIGGLIGVLAAWGVAALVRALTPVPMAVPVSAVVVGVGLSMVVGLFFGIYPAQRASKLDPIEALRTEQ